MNASELAQRDERQKEEAAKRRAADQELREREKREHAEAVQAEIERSKTALDAALEGLSKPEQKQVRLFAAAICIVQGEDTPNEKQSRYDNTALRLARYVSTGVA